MQDLPREILKEGIVKLEGFVPLEDIEPIKQEVLEKIENFSEGGYQFGKALNFIPLENLAPPSSEVRKVFDNELIKSTKQEYLGDNYLHAIQATHDYIANEELARNGYLHFDRFHTLKFFLYLTDCDEDCGPFSVVRGSRYLGAQLRKKAWSNSSDYSQVKNRIEIDYPHLDISKKDSTPMTGKAGDLLIFDSDIFHFGGVLKEGNERLVLRSHYMTR